MEEIHIDIETFSSVPIERGTYKYAESPDFEILLFAYSVDGAPVEVVDLANGETVPLDIMRALTDTRVVKSAFHANFERVCISYWLRNNYPDYFHGYGASDDSTGNYLDPHGWRCSMVWCSYLGLPMSLAGVGAILGLEQQKMKEGKDLIRYFCQPCKPTQKNQERTRNLPEHAPDKWSLFKSYNKRDVEVEMAIQQKISRYPVPEHEWEMYVLDQTINDRGVRIDIDMATAAMNIDQVSRNATTEELKAITGLDNPNSVLQMSNWLKVQGLGVDSLGKKQVEELLKTAPPELAKVLQLRQKLAKSSVKKYEAMVSSACSDSRCRGLFQFMGASRSLRWAGRNVQLQNLPQNHMAELSEARALVTAKDYETLDILFDNVPTVLSELVRTALIPKDDNKFIISDFSAIEARVLSWIANETWRNEVFANNGDIYCASASAMFGVPVSKHGPNAHLRQKGKIAELALGYGGGVKALEAMGALDMGLAAEELPLLVAKWREANPAIVGFWWAVDKAAKDAITFKTTTSTHGTSFTYTKGMLFVHLPSGSTLHYVKPRIEQNDFGSECITYEGTKLGHWLRMDTYGPKLVENIIQSLARSCLCFAMENLRGIRIVAHVHDEIIAEVNPGVTVDSITRIMGVTPTWAPGLVLNAAGYSGEFYFKD